MSYGQVKASKQFWISLTLSTRHLHQHFLGGRQLFKILNQLREHFLIFDVLGKLSFTCCRTQYLRYCIYNRSLHELLPLEIVTFIENWPQPHFVSLSNKSEALQFVHPSSAPKQAGLQLQTRLRKKSPLSHRERVSSSALGSV